MHYQLLEKLQSYFETIHSQNSPEWVKWIPDVVSILISAFFLGLITLGLALYYFTYFKFKKTKRHLTFLDRITQQPVSLPEYLN